jgi:hypothetical protein
LSSISDSFKAIFIFIRSKMDPVKPLFSLTPTHRTIRATNLSERAPLTFGHGVI